MPSHRKIDDHDPTLQPGSATPPVSIPRELIDQVLAWEADREECAAAEDDPHGPAPWWEDSDDVAIEILQQLSHIIKSAVDDAEPARPHANA